MLKRYEDFALEAIARISSIGYPIISAITTGSVVKGIGMFQAFLLMGFGMFFLEKTVLTTTLSSRLEVQYVHSTAGYARCVLGG